MSAPVPLGPSSALPGSPLLRATTLGATFGGIAVLATMAPGGLLLWVALGGRLSLGLVVYAVLIPSILSAAMSITALCLLTAGSIRARRDPRAISPVVTVVPALACFFAIPAAFVIGLSETGSSSWHAVYLLFLPAGAAIGVHAAVVVASFGLRIPGLRAVVLAAPALLGSIGTPFIVGGLFYSTRLGSAGVYAGLATGAFSVLFDLVLALLGRQAARRLSPTFAPRWSP